MFHKYGSSSLTRLPPFQVHRSPRVFQPRMPEPDRRRPLLGFPLLTVGRRVFPLPRALILFLGRISVAAVLGHGEPRAVDDISHRFLEGEIGEIEGFVVANVGLLGERISAAFVMGGNNMSIRPRPVAGYETSSTHPPAF